MEKSINPFNVSFGEEPNSVIFRKNEFDEIVNVFDNEYPESKIKIIVGPRGCGKTVLLSQVKKYYNNKNDWVTVDLIQYSNMLEQLAAKLYENGKAKKLFLKTEFNFSFSGLSFSIKGESPVSNVDSLLEKMIAYLNKKSIRILITVDDIANNDFVKQFVQTYQGLLREKNHVYLLMTGLYENVSDLQNVNNLTFLLRAPKIYLGKLNLRAIAFAYQKYLNVDDKYSIELAKLTNGYAYAYQLIGSKMYKKSNDILSEEELKDIDLMLEDNVYEKIWESMSALDRKFVFAMINYNSVSDIIKELDINNAKFQVYRKRLINIGVIDDTERGFVYFYLPRFKEFVEFKKELE